MRKFVTAFAGRRDGYQVPLALAEAGRLQRLVTSFYLKNTWERVAKGVLGRVPAVAQARRMTNIQDEDVRCVLAAELMEQVGRRARIAPHRYWKAVNRLISRVAAVEADRHQCDLLLYEPYAPQAFRFEYRGFTPRKILFHFHPHPDLEAKIYADDLSRHPTEMPWLTPDSGGRADAADVTSVKDVWKEADLILCASSFTKESLTYAGADPQRCRVIPYGIDSAPAPPARTSDQTFRVLFVGSGIQRKGIHHLLAAWQHAVLPTDAELWLVSRTIDPQLESVVSGLPRCRLVQNATRDEIEQLYRQASVLVVPSLVEGFGQVYLEALAQGCPVIGTRNTGLPDLGSEADGIFLTQPGDTEDLAHRLEWFAAEVAGDPNVSHAAWRTGNRFSWSRFRRELLAIIE